MIVTSFQGPIKGMVIAFGLVVIARCQYLQLREAKLAKETHGTGHRDKLKYRDCCGVELLHQ